MTNSSDLQAIRSVVADYLDGMIYGDAGKLRKAMHPLCMQAGHHQGQYEFFPRDEFIAALASEEKVAAGTPYRSEILSIDVTGDIAAIKVSDDCFGTSWTDYLTLIRHDGVWQIVMKAFYNHANDGKPNT